MVRFARVAIRQTVLRHQYLPAVSTACAVDGAKVTAAANAQPSCSAWLRSTHRPPCGAVPLGVVVSGCVAVLSGGMRQVV